MIMDTKLKVLTAIELTIAAAVILLDVFIPTLVILVLTFSSLFLRRENTSSLGFKKIDNPFKTVISIFLFSIIWTLLIIGLVMPVLNHLTGSTQVLSAFEQLKGNVGQLIILLIASWTLAALGEEIVYRGLIQNRILGLFRDIRIGMIVSIGVSSMLFGLAHTEQGVIGVIVTTLDAVFFSLIKYKYNNNVLASVLAHGFNNTIGVTAFFFLGPIYGLW